MLHSNYTKDELSLSLELPLLELRDRLDLPPKLNFVASLARSGGWLRQERPVELPCLHSRAHYEL